MKRRDFLKMSSMATLAYSINGIPLHAFGQDGPLKTSRAAGDDKVLVLVRLSGGNDGLNTIIPLDRYLELSNARSSILIPETEVLPLQGTPNTGMHPSMTMMQDMYNNGKMNIIQGVSYPTPDYSHFRATDIFSSGSDSAYFINSGWIGRFIDTIYPGAPQAYPTSAMLDPLSIEIGSVASSVLIGDHGLNGFNISSLDYFYQIVNGTVDPQPNTRGGNDLNYIRFVAQQTQSYNGRIQLASNAGNNTATYADNYLAQQLKIVAKLISGGLKTPVYIVTQYGYDTHDTQVDAGDHKIGAHANLLKELSDAIGTFQQDIETQNIQDKVIGMTFSEFGRRIISNASNGTDHGDSAPMIVFGSKVNSGILGDSPAMPTAPTVYDRLPMQHDFRQIYSTILTDWFGIDNTTSRVIMNNADYEWLPILGAKPLPITLKSFLAITQQCDVVLKWETIEEVNANFIELQFSKNNHDFEFLSKHACKGNGSEYKYVHAAPLGDMVYRLRLVDHDGKESFSQSVAINAKCNETYTNIYPNPADAVLHVDIKGRDNFVMLTLINSEGRMVRTEINNNSNSTISTSDLASGVYQLLITDNEGSKETHKILIKH
jgi:uncharacterized protein (DUF1501 family)